MRKWLIVLAMFFVCSVNAQQTDAQTSNIVYTTLNPPPPGVPVDWTGFINVNTGGGGLSGGNIPAYNPYTGTFIFGYTTGTVAYSTPINYALANAGTGIRVNGFKYSWEYYNQDLSKGTLTGNISLTNSSGQVVENYNYNLPQTTNSWTRMSGTENFSTHYIPSDLGNLNVSFTGKDDRYWAGYYGPQVRDINVNLLYSIIPSIPTDFSYWIKLTDENGTFTLNKTGVVRYGAEGVYMYQNLEPGTYSCSNGAWGNDPIGGVYKACELGTNKTVTPTIPKSPTGTTTEPTTATAITNSTTEPTNTATTTIANPTTVATPTNNTTEVSNTTTPTATTSSTNVSSPVVTTSAASTSTTPTATNPQPKVGEVTVSGSQAKTTLSTTQILSIVRNEQTRIGNLETSTAQRAVEQAQSASDKTQKESLSISSATVTQSQASAQAAVSLLSVNTQNANSTSNTQSNNTTGSSATNQIAGRSVSFIGIKPPELETNIVQTPISKTQNIYNLIMTPTYNQSDSNGTVSSQINYSMNKNDSLKIQDEQIKSEGVKFNTTNPIFNIINTPIHTQTETTEKKETTAVNSKVQDNEASGGVKLNMMAIQPKGFDSYGGILSDVSFYKPKEIYQNQKVVDNNRAFRQLASDRLHQEMIDQQYKK